MDNARITKSGVEENTLAILDSSGVRDARDILDDKLSFLEAVRAASLVSDSSSVPTCRMYDAVFEIFYDKGASLELVTACHQLLRELDLRYPRVFFVNAKESASANRVGGDFVVVKEAWSPFAVGPEYGQSEVGTNSKEGRLRVDSGKFSLLVQEIAEAVNNLDCQPCMKLVRKLVLVQYLHSVLQDDFSPRLSAYKDTMNWVLVRESLLNMLLGSRRLNFKSIVRDCLAIINNRCLTYKGVMSYEQCEGSADNFDAAFVLSLREIENETCGAVQKLLALIMELDELRKEADRLRFTSRADSVRSPVLELVVDELTYDKELASPFLLVFSVSKWKLEIVLQYVWKYCQKPAVRTRKSSNSEGDATLDAVLAYLLNATNMRNLTRKVPTDVVRVLLSHALEAYLSMHCFCETGGNDQETFARSLLVKICNNFISIFKNLRKVDKDVILSPFEGEALFTANVIVSKHL